MALHDYSREDHGLAPIDEIRDEIDAAEERNRRCREAGLGGAAIDIARGNGQIKPNGTILGPGSVNPIRIGRKAPKRNIDNHEEYNA